jgi:hypothetical protein
MKDIFIFDYKTWKLNENNIDSSGPDIKVAIDFVKKLINRGFTKEEAAAIAGNVWHESKFNPAAIFGELFRKPLADMNREIEFIKSKQTAYGLMQWRAERKNALADFAKSKGQHPATIKLQADFMKYELKDKYDGKYAYETTMFQRAMEYGKTVDKKAKGFAEKSERAGTVEPARIESALIIYKSI